MTLKSVKNDFKDIIGFAQKQMVENNSYINMFIISDFSDTIKGDAVLEIQSSKTGTTEYLSIKDVYIDTDFENGFVTYKFILDAPFDGKKELVINVSKIGRHDTSLYKHYLYDIKQPNKIAYRLLFKKKKK